MKRLLLLTFVLLAANMMWAGVVTEQQALQKAQQFMKGKKFQAKSQPRFSGGGTTASPSLYIFNAEGKGGFVIVSADDRTDEILGYANSGEMNVNNLPSNLKAWLEGYEKYIQSLGNREVNSTPRALVGDAIPYLIKTQWDQGTPYNLQCPEYPEGSGQRCLTGCVATAMAQVLYYYKYPKDEISGLESYTTRTDPISVDALPSTTFIWKNMTTDDQELAKLMRYCGQLVEMDYAQDGSGAATQNILNLKNWGYSQEAKIVERTAYSDEEWENLIYRELAAKRPVLYSGNNESGGDGHQFICDGYDGNGLFHMNWGWGGYQDTYFVLSALNPNGYNFNYGQDAIINLQPSDGSMPMNLEGTEFTATTTEGVVMNFKITYDDGCTRTCEVSQYKNDGTRNRCISTSYRGAVTIPAMVTYNGNSYTVTKIGANAFEDCQMASVNIPSTVKTIDSYAISWCNYLRELNIPASVTSISNNALYYTTRSLTSLIVDADNQVYESPDNSNVIIEKSTNKLLLGCKGSLIPSNITEIGDMAFYGISGLTITIPNSITKIGYGAFAYCSAAIITAEYQDLSSIWVADGAFSGASNNNMILRVPAGTKNAYKEAQGWSAFPVDNIFEGDEGTEFTATMNGVSMTFTITSISEKTVKVGYLTGDRDHTAISRTTQQTAITVNNTVNYNDVDYTVTAVGPYAFYNIENMQRINLPETIEKIGNYAFQDCYNLTSFELPARVWSFENNILRNCPNLNSLTVASGNTTYYSVENSNAVLEQGSNKLILGIKNTVIPEIVTEIGDYAFDHVSSLNLTIPTTVNTIGQYAFAYCSSAIITAQYEDLSEITVSRYAFNGASGNGMTLRVPAGMKELYKNATGWSEFAEDHIYEGNAGTEFTQKVNGVDMTFTITSDNSTSKTVKVGRLNGNWSNTAIARDTQQKTITVPDKITYNGTDYSVTSVGDYAFCNINNIQQIILPTTIESIGNSAIRDCGSLTTIEIPAKVATLGNDLFTYCSNITSLTVAEDNTIYESRGCNVIIEKATNTLIRGTKNGTIPTGVEVIGATAFSNMNGLSLTIPGSVTSIGDYAFGWCSNSVFTVESDTPLTINENVFEGAGYNRCVLRVPAGAKAAYLAATGWKQFGEDNIFEGNEGLEFTEEVTVGEEAVISMIFTVTGDGDNKTVKVGHLAGDWENPAISKTTSVTAIRMPDTVIHDGVEYTVTAIGDYAFCNIERLEQLQLPTTITSIGDNAFNNSYNLKALEIPSNVSKIGSNIIQYCSSLVSLTVDADNAYYEAPDGCNALIEKQSHKLIAGTKGTKTIPNSVTEIGDYAFEDVSGLTLTIPENVQYIGMYAFAWCYSSVYTVKHETPIAIHEFAFYRASNNNSILKVPTGSRDAYLAATGWNLFKPENVLEGNAGTEFTEKVSVRKWDNSTNGLIDGEIDMVFTVTGTDGEYQTVKVGPLNGSSSNTAINESLTRGSEIDIPEFITHEDETYRITAIGNYAFRGKSFFKKITLPETITSIGDCAFESCNSLTEFEIPKSVTGIGNYAFRWDYNIVLSVAEGNTVYDSRDNCNAVIETASNTLVIGSRATKQIPSSVSAIGDDAFYNQNSLELTIPETVNYIGNYAFAYCYSSTFTVESRTPATINEHAFDGAQEEIIILKVPAGCKETYLATTGWDKFQRQNVYQGDEGTEFSANINGINWIFTVTDGSTTPQKAKLGRMSSSDAAIDWATTDGINWDDIPQPYAIPSTVENNGVTYQVAAIGAYAFWGVDIPSVSLPETITEIGNSAFAYCPNLTEITIPVNVTSIDTRAFYGNSLTSVTVDSDNQVYDSRNNCNAVIETATNKLVIGTKGTVIPATVTEIGQNAFAEIRGLIITLPETVTTINSYAFEYCVDLILTVVNETPLEVDYDAFWGVQWNNGTLRVPAGTKDAYSTANQWNYFPTIDEYDSDIIPGDANGDGDVDVTDVVSIVNYILGNSSDSFVAAAADVNGDGDVDVTDVVAVVNIILNVGASTRSKDNTSEENTDNDRLTLALSNRQEATLCLDNNGKYVASQFDIRVPAGQSLEKIVLNGKRVSSHQIVYTEIEQNLYRVLIYSVGNETYLGHQGDLLAIKLTDGVDNLEISNIQFITECFSVKRFATLYGQATGIDSIETMPAADIYSLNGRLVSKQASTTKGLKKGIYIINNQKVYVK